MSNNRYVPRDFMPYSPDFGKRATAEWRDAWPDGQEYNDRELDQLAASQEQHRLVCEIGLVLATKYMTIAEFADRLDQKPARVARMLRGETVMRFEDVAAAERILGRPLGKNK
jgi:hypothetical protein